MTSKSASPVTDPQDTDLAVLRSLLETRSRGPFVSIEEGRKQTERMIAEFTRLDLDDGE